MLVPVMFAGKAGETLVEQRVGSRPYPQTLGTSAVYDLARLERPQGQTLELTTNIRKLQTWKVL